MEATAANQLEGAYNEGGKGWSTADMVKFVPREVSQGRNTETVTYEEAHLKIFIPITSMMMNIILKDGELIFIITSKKILL